MTEGTGWSKTVCTFFDIQDDIGNNLCYISRVLQLYLFGDPAGTFKLCSGSDHVLLIPNEYKNLISEYFSGQGAIPYWRYSPRPCAIPLGTGQADSVQLRDQQYSLDGRKMIRSLTFLNTLEMLKVRHACDRKVDFMSNHSNKSNVRYITVTGVLSATAFLLQLIEIPVPMLMPTFIKFDFSDLPALIGSFAMGPLCGILIELIKNLIHAALASGSFGVGELSNFVLGAVFVGVAGLIYRFNRSKKGALLASFAGAVSMAAVSFPSNLLVVYPVYYQFMPEETILAAYQAILPGMKSVAQSLLIFNVPFTFVKGMLDVIVTFLIYKKISPILKGNQ